MKYQKVYEDANWAGEDVRETSEATALFHIDTFESKRLERDGKCRIQGGDAVLLTVRRSSGALALELPVITYEFLLWVQVYGSLISTHDS